MKSKKLRLFFPAAELSRNTICSLVPDGSNVLYIPFCSIGKHRIGAGTIASIPFNSQVVICRAVRSTIKYHVIRGCARNLPTPNCAFLVASFVVEDSSLASTSFKGSCARSNMASMWVTSRCRELSWTFTTKNYHKKLIDLYLWPRKYVAVILCALWLHTRCEFGLSAATMWLCSVAMQKTMSSLTCQRFPPRFGLLSLFVSKAAKQNGSFKMISGPMLSTKYMSTCRTIRNQRKIPTWRLRLGVMAADADVDEGRTIREFLFLLFLF